MTETQYEQAYIYKEEIEKCNKLFNTIKSVYDKTDCDDVRKLCEISSDLVVFKQQYYKSKFAEL